MILGSVSQSFHFFWFSPNSIFLRFAVSLCAPMRCVCLLNCRTGRISVTPHISSPPCCHPGRPQLHTTADGTPWTPTYAGPSESLGLISRSRVVAGDRQASLFPQEWPGCSLWGCSSPCSPQSTGESSFPVDLASFAFILLPNLCQANEGRASGFNILVTGLVECYLLPSPAPVPWLGLPLAWVAYSKMKQARRAWSLGEILEPDVLGSKPVSAI